MIDFSKYTKGLIETAMLEQVDNSLDKREGSLIQTAVAPVAWFLEGSYMSLDQVQQNGSPFYAVGDALDNIVALRGLQRKQATAAVRQGTFNVAVPAGSQFRTINGADSAIFEAGDLISSATDAYVYAMTCLTAGTIGNAYTGSILPITAVAGLTSAYLGAIITEGADEETDDALRARFFSTFGAIPYGGNIAEYRQAILGINGVGAVQIYPAWQGGGTVKCSILNSDFAPASPALVQLVQNEICPPEEGGSTPSANGYGIAPIGAAVTISTGTELTLAITATVEFQANIEDGLEYYSEDIKAAIRAYIASVREAWGDALTAHSITYPVVIYASRMIYAILSVPQVVNVASLTINGASGDCVLTETSALQQVPVVGTITINEV
ncbi:MAG: baseplate J/gp47 family protein [Oscillospiraceae bacterium]|nr:baseplate J/gp47 family protein [Oscillospiraceae bacterium]